MNTQLFFFTLQNSRIFLALGLLFAAVCPAIGDDESYADKLTHARLFAEQRLVWIGQTAPSEAESKELWDAFGVGRNHSFSDAVESLETFIKDHPNSPWVPALRANMGVYYRDSGYFTRALDDWQEAWNATFQMHDPKGTQVANYALVNWLQLLSSLGRTEKIKELLDETKNRPLLGPYHAWYHHAQVAYDMMVRDPDISYRCGTFALNNVAQVLTGTNYFRQIWEQSSPSTGFSMASLMMFAQSNHLNMAAVEREHGDQLVVPSVVHWKQNHYAAIVAQRGDLYKVIDPTFRMSRWISANAINSECSGQFLVSDAAIPEGWRTLTSEEASQIYGKGFVTYYDSPYCGAGDGGSGGGPWVTPLDGGGGLAGGHGGILGVGSGSGSGSGSGGSGGSGGGGGGGCCGNDCPTCTGPGSQGSGNGNSNNNNNNSCGCTSPEAVGGMPNWTVMEPWCDVWLTDEPLAYQPAKGPRISFKLVYWEDLNPLLEEGWAWPQAPNLDGFLGNFGWNWTCSWFSFIETNTPGDGEMTLFTGGGGSRIYTNCDGTVPEFSTRTRCFMDTNSSGAVLGYTILYPSGAQYIYTNGIQPSVYAGSPYYFLSQQKNPDGQATTFLYTNDGDGGVLLQYVIDGDGKTNTLDYTDVTNSDGDVSVYDVVSSITDAHGHTTTFGYDHDPGPDGNRGNGNLTNVIDPAGISSIFGYDTSAGQDTSSQIASLTTPYGTTTFYTEAGFMDPTVVVTEPDGSHQAFCYKPGDDHNGPGLEAYSAAIPITYTDPRYVPTVRPPDSPGGSNTLDNPDWNNPDTNGPAKGDLMQDDNSFYWGRQQFANLSGKFMTTYPNWDFQQMTTNDLINARLRHWLVDPDTAVRGTLSMERDPSPDGATLGEMTWYDYPNKPDYFYEGSLDTPTLIIKVLDDGSNQYQLNELDQWGNITNKITTYSENGVVLTRTNSYLYSTNGIDLLKVIGPDGVTNAQYGYDNNHAVLFMTNALGEVTSYTYNSLYEQLTSITQPNGQVTTNIYGSDGHLTQQIVIGISTNSYTWTNDLVYSHTDQRGLTVTNSWDPLNRLTNITYPDGTSISYIYSNLDIVQSKDRLGYSTYYTYNPVRQKTSQTDALGHTTYYDYCQCGALYSITDALVNVTYFQHDNQGNLLQVNYPDGYSITNTYNLLHQAIVKSDSSGLILSNFYNNQGLLIVSSNNVGLVHALAYDVDDRLTNTTDANDVSIGMSYDNLSRIQTRRYPDTGVEKWVYTTDISLPTSYTNQITNVWLYSYDMLNRKTNEVCVGVTTNGFSYDGAGDLVTLTDGKNDTTTWIYDQYGRVTNKVDTAGNTNFVYQYDNDNRLTNRWTPARGNTKYRYDAVGNLTNVIYPVSTNISLSYDAGNRLTSMVDGIGTTAYAYDEVGQLLSEGGLWPSDTVSNIYKNRLRMELTLSHSGASPWMEDYSYDTVRRLEGVESPAGTFGYTFDQVKLQRVDEILLPNSAYITNTYDSVARLLSTALINTGGTNLDSAYYVYNTAGQRTSETNVAGDYRNYTYDNEGELVAAKGKEGGGAGRINEQFGYVYDAAGNLNFRTNNALIQAFNVNDLNELTTTTNSGTLTVAGTTAIPVTSLTVNGLSANHYADATFALGGFTVTNGVNFYRAIGEDSSGDFSTNSVTLNLPATNNYTYDSDGNLLSDGTRNFAYDDENELISVCVSNTWSNSFAYDGKLRRRIEREYAWQGSAWAETNEIHFIYDGNVVVEERSANNNPLVSYTRGNDLSGSSQRAGGIGGMLARTTYGQEIPGAPTTAFYHADGNGNITALMYPSQQLAAKYLFDPYGNILAMSGPLMDFNKYRFSSKEWNDNAGLSYYGYRFYDPNLQRWLNRDPFAEIGFEAIRTASLQTWRQIVSYKDLFEEPNGYEFVSESPVDQIDYLGLITFMAAPQPQPPTDPNPTPCGDFTNKTCREGCKSLYANNNKMYQACITVCNTVGGKSCNSLWAYCEHMMRHGDKNGAESCVEVFDILCGSQ